MPRNGIEVTGDKELMAVFDKLKLLPEDKAEEEMENTAVEIVGRMVKSAPVDTGNLRRNILVDKTEKGIEISSRALNKAGRDYAPYVEYGTRFTRPQPYFWINIKQGIEDLNKRLTAMFNKLHK